MKIQAPNAAEVAGRGRTADGVTNARRLAPGSFCADVPLTADSINEFDVIAVSAAAR